MYHSAHPTAKRFVECTLKRIQLHGGSKGVNLRMIARDVGCAHTNAYNYFSDFNELLWTAFLEILHRMVHFTQENIGSDIERPGLVDRFIESQVDFAVAHPGWYRFIWLEGMPGEPSDEIITALLTMRMNFMKRIYAGMGSGQSKRRPEAFGDMIHAYLHGEICKLISNRFGMHDGVADVKKKIIDNVRFLLELYNRTGCGEGDVA